MEQYFPALSAIRLGAVLLSRTSFAESGDWTNLLDPKLTQFDLWIGVPPASVTGLPPGPAQSDNAPKGKPPGRGNDPKRVFSVIEEGGQPVLKITGGIFGALTTLTEYGNYHFTCHVKFGEQKWASREAQPRDSGVLYHSTGPHGAAGSVWMRSLEFQVMENNMGDLFRVAGTARESLATLAKIPLHRRKL